MFLSNFSIRQPVTTVAIIVVLMCLGLLAIKNLRVNSIPDVQEPVLVVVVPYPGASPEAVEREIINRVEKPLQSVPGERDPLAATRPGADHRHLQLPQNMVEAADEIRNAISQVRHKLPLEMREPVLFRADPSQEPVMQLALSSKSQTLAEISRLAEDQLADRFRGINGVSTVDVNGSLRRELSVLLRAQKLREYNVSVAEVVGALRRQNTTAPVGQVKGALQTRASASWAASNPRASSRIVRRSGDEIVRLGQVATVQDGFAEQADTRCATAIPMSASRSRGRATRVRCPLPMTCASSWRRSSRRCLRERKSP
jgi:HAE1 family hydrophobic/amphiphilic exporter-1